MKKILPCSLTNKFSLLLLFFVSLLGTSNLTAQCNASAEPRFVCAGPGNNIIYTTASVLLDNGTTLTWTITGDSTGGAKFVNNNSTVSTTTISSGLFNSVAVLLGPLSGSTEVRMSLPGDPPGTGCAASVFTKVLVVQGSATPVDCPNDLTTVSITPGLTGTKLGTSDQIVQFPSLPGGCGQYTYNLVTSPGGVIVATNNTGTFPGQIPQDYVIRITDCDGCTADSPVINGAPVPPNPIITNCPLTLSHPSCQFADQTALDAHFQNWLDSFSTSGGFPPLITNTIPGAPIQAPNLCGGAITVQWIVTDRCEQEETCTATYTITPPPIVTPLLPGNREVRACDIVDAAALAALVNAYVAEFRAEGGCAPRVELDPYVLPNLCEGVLNITGRIVDRCDVVIPVARTFTILAAVPPVITCAPGGALGCNPTIPDPTAPTVDSECPTLPYTSVDVITGTDCARILTRTYTVTNSCGQSDTCDQVFTYRIDTTAPTLICVANKEVACDAAVVFDAPSATDNCTATGDIDIIDGAVVVVDNGDGTFSHTKSWTAEDECDNVSASCSQTILVLSCAEPNGCTLGYWKNHTLAWDCYTTCTLYNSVFTGSTLDPNLTLLQALNLGGGSCNNLARQSVAALLNICDGTLDFSVATEAELVALVNAAFANGTCGAAGSLLDGFNNEGGANHCDVVKSPNTSQSTCTSTRKGADATGKVAPSSTFMVYPNPFSNTFSINSTNLNHSINMSIYDVLGRSVETRTITPDEFNSPLYGRDYPTGMYNIILNQATEQKTLRVIKQ